MFRVQENEDGSTSIFCKTNNSLICTIRGQQRGQSVGLSCRIPRPVNIVEPSIKADNCGSRDDLSTSDYLDQKDVKPNSRYLINGSRCCISPLPVMTEDEEVNEDFSDDCITQEQFARCLNLVSKTKYNNESTTKLKAEFPLRLQSRTTPMWMTEDLRDLKLSDDMPLTSMFGVKILQLNSHKNFVSKQVAAIAIKKYDTFCRFPINSAKVSSCSFPKLRCREKKEYPICIPQKILKLEVTHKYCFGKKQRLERIRILETGLDKRSRRLYRMCNSRTLQVNMKKISQEAIKEWTARKPEIITIIDEPDAISNEDCSKPSKIEFQPVVSSYISKELSEENVPILKELLLRPSISVKSFSSTKSRFQDFKKLKRESNFKKSKKIENCYIKTVNILRCICKSSGNYYVKGTNIRVPFLLESLQSSRKDILKYYRPCPKTSVIYDSFSFRSGEKSAHKSDYTSFGYNPSVQNNLVSKPFHSNVSQIFSKSSLQDHTNSKPIPIVDLTMENMDPGKKKDPNLKTLVLYNKRKIKHWVFHCFGCGDRRIFLKEASNDAAVIEHMRIYHSVLEPDTFLSTYKDNVNNCIITEAFPGYKGSE